VEERVVRCIPGYPQLDDWFRLEVTVIWERVALHTSVALPARHLDRNGLQDARRTLNAPSRPFRVSKFFLGVHRMNKECGALQSGDAFPSPGTRRIPCQRCIPDVPLQPRPRNSQPLVG
jgi:hypothetical protein